LIDGGEASYILHRFTKEGGWLEVDQPFCVLKLLASGKELKETIFIELTDDWRIRWTIRLIYLIFGAPGVA